MRFSQTKRRDFIGGLAGSLILPSFASAKQIDPADPPDVRTGMGLVIYDCKLRRDWLHHQDPSQDLFQPMIFLRHCHRLGAGGMQAALGTLSSSQIDELGGYAKRHGLFIDAIIKPPADSTDLTRFDAEMETAKHVGVQAARTTILPGRRYERFKTLEEFRDFERRGRRMLELAEPIANKHQVPLAVENHKDQRLDERLSLLRHISSQWIGVCLDTGNSFALLDGAYEPIQVLAPFTMSVHLKDQALQGYQDGFLLGDIPLGQGSFDMKRIVDIIRQAKPDIKFTLELITRDALRVPCLTESFYATLPTLDAAQLAKTMQFVNRNRVAQLQQVSGLAVEQQVQLEDANVATSIRHAARELKL